MIGERIGNFTIKSQLGAGGMGEVFLGVHDAIGTKVAIKMLLPHISAHKDHVERFFNEAIAAGKIQHSGIGKIFDVGFDARGRAYLVMEFLDGETLAARIRRLGRLPVDQLRDIGKQTASVLDAVHKAGITHRDLKPDNIFLVGDSELDSGERVKVLDFGIAKLSAAGGLTATGAGTMGTPAYMAPEQWRSSKNVDWRADAYSLGCVAFEMATGHPPFAFETIGEACGKHLTEEPARISTIAPVPVDLDSLVASLLAKSPDQRPSSMREIGKAFAGSTGASSSMPQVSASLPAARIEPVAPTMPLTRSAPTTLGAAAGSVATVPVRASRRGLLFAGIGGVAIAAIAVAVGVAKSSSSESPERTAAGEPTPAAPDAAVASVTPIPSTPDAPAEPAEPPKDAGISTEYSAAMDAHRSRISKCAQDHDAVTVPSHASVDIVVATTGKSKTISLEPASLDASPLGTCIKGALAAVKFPPAATEKFVSFPIKASPRRDPPAASVAAKREDPPPAAKTNPPTTTTGSTKAMIVSPTAVTRVSGETPTLTASQDVPAMLSAKVCIDISGAVTSTTPMTKLSSDIAANVARTLQTWRYAPYKVDGKPVPACFVVSFRTKTATTATAKRDGEPDFDELLKESQNAPNTPKPKLDRTSLTGADFKQGMAAVQGKAQACYAGTAGTANVKILISPSGQVSKVTVSGAFAGTPVGSCVEAAVRAATFPPWDGGPQTFNYSFLLSE